MDASQRSASLVAITSPIRFQRGRVRLIRSFAFVPVIEAKAIQEPVSRAATASPWHMASAAARLPKFPAVVVVEIKRTKWVAGVVAVTGKVGIENTPPVKVPQLVRVKKINTKFFAITSIVI